MPTPSERSSAIMLKIITGLIGAGFTVLTILMNNMWARLDRMDDKFDRYIFCKMQGGSEGLPAAKSNKTVVFYNNLNSEGILPDEIKVKTEL